MSLDKETLLDSLRSAGKTAEAKLDAHGVRASEDDVPVFDRARHRRRERSLRRDMLDEVDSWKG